MAELARWQWDDFGIWRDFAEQHQAEMEASYQRRTPGVELAIPPFGTFRMDLQRMKQVTVSGRNAGYERDIRRQARHIEVGYFILGCEGEIFASDSPLDHIEARPVLEVLDTVLLKIIDEPMDFSHRSISLSDEPFCETLGKHDQATKFLSERGFELIQEGNARFLVFMMEEVDGLREAQQEVQARLQRLHKQKAIEDQCTPSKEATLPSNEVSAQSIASDDVAFLSNDVTALWGGLDGNPDAFAHSNDISTASQLSGTAFASAASSRGVIIGEGVSEGPSRHGAPGSRAASGKGFRNGGKGARKGRGKGKGVRKIWRVKKPSDSFMMLAIEDQSVSAVGAFADRTPAVSSEQEPGFCLRDSRVTLVLPGGVRRCVELQEDTLEELLEVAKQATGLRLPLLRTQPLEKPLALASEPGLTLRQVAGLERKDVVVVENFEASFVDKLQSGLLRLQDLASVAPLLDWSKPELLKLFLGRMRSLLEGSCSAWCHAAGCQPDDELVYGRALLKRLYGHKPLEARLEVCRQVLPVEKREQCTVLTVDRNNFMPSAITALQRLSSQELRKYLTVHFVGEVAEDHGGPRRDFFGCLGSRLVADLPVLWRRLGRGALVPVADVVAESSPKEACCGVDSAASVYRTCGRACALATKTGDVIGEELASFFLHQVARDDTVELKDLQQQLAEADGDDIRTTGDVLQKPLAETGLKGLTMTRTITRTDLEVELLPGGRDMPVTEDNKAEWLQLHLRHKLHGSLQKAADSFRAGILDVFGGSRRTSPLFVLLSPAELSQLWAGCAVSEEAVRRWRDVAAVSEEVRMQTEWLWELLLEGDEELRSRVLQFSTGSRRLGPAGLQSFEVQPADGGDESLPRAMTCAPMLQLPRYSCKAALEKQLHKALELGHGFQIL